MSYQALYNRFKRIGDVKHALEMLHWDQMVMMAPGSNAVRTEALATLEEMIHELTAAPEIGEWIESAAVDLDPWQVANVGQMRSQWIRARAVPADLVTALAKAKSACEEAWRPARDENDWDAVLGKLTIVVDLTREYAAALAGELGCNPYEALLDEYEPGLRLADIEPIFTELADVLPPLIDMAIDGQPKPLPLKGPFPIERQEALGRELMTVLGFDFNSGRMDVSSHPFTGGALGDTRITTRYSEQDFFGSMFAILHETAHARYQQGLPGAWRGQPVGYAGGMALHESQSLLIERQVCRGPAFVDFVAPLIQRTLLGTETAAVEWQPDNLGKLARQVNRGRIRVDADELTYSLHVILRYELETGLVDGTLTVADLPEAWDKKMSTYLGLSTAGDYKNGSMQDIHWFIGAVGYFPCYTLGAVMASQLYSAAKNAIPGLEDTIRGGHLSALMDWLRENVHSRGRLQSSMELMVETTGSKLETAAFLDHLRSRYSPGH